ncbi:predicted protein [Sclerotinia sclerotiorum 1980 UF-70]|uniref:Uncharacterized protein n=2 Tax=Sclerotinia sclerotiorum (strain ATCC 18683 / 1980 / Ss-1) TaxID=665079 RepID=A7F4G6_SCLS1|nr:predicted protein [Sclerotinia sclerotiorum 1980 UF-70]APA10665.1 hypothetical protein sscle_06g054350 [Sclerotinia sclerotiorum 1980 UF-70]EDN97637.1 predicted protein [Sclerotinia sclerotiorum 1980 UF-70]
MAPVSAKYLPGGIGDQMLPSQATFGGDLHRRFWETRWVGSNVVVLTSRSTTLKSVVLGAFTPCNIVVVEIGW